MQQRTKELFIVGGLLVVAIAVGFIIWRRLAPEPRLTPDQSAVPASNPALVPTAPSIVPALGPAETDQLQKEIDAVYKSDKDFDGLSDDEEAKIGTHPEMADSDNDGILDQDEIKIYTTDPLQPDTDGDSFSDGYEVTRGYNPKGPGKITP